jgi:hypothetical protein
LLVGWFSLLGAVIHTTLYYSRSNAASINTLAPVSSLSLFFLDGFVPRRRVELDCRERERERER